MSTPAGWYDDGHGTQRWWDGTAWTEHTQPTAPSVPEPAAAAPDPVAPEQVDAAPPAPAAAEPADVIPPAPAVADGAYPPPAAASGAYPPPTVPAAQAGQKSSKAWIIPVAIIGGIIVLLIVLAAIFIPMLVGSLTGGGSADGQTADEQAAVQAVESYDDAWGDADCDLFLAVTTESFRESQELPDCDAFVPTAEDFGEATEDYELTVDSVTTSGSTITVETTETFTSLFDENDDPAPEGIPVSQAWTYHLIEEDGAWRIDDASYE